MNPIEFVIKADTSQAVAALNNFKGSLKEVGGTVSGNVGGAMSSLGGHMGNLSTYARVLASEFGDKAKGAVERFGTAIGDFAKNPIGAAQGGITSLISSMGPLAMGIGGIAVGVGVAAKALFDLAASAADEVEQLENLSAQTGLSTQDLQALGNVAKEAGLQGLDLGRTIGQLNMQLGEGNGDFIDALDKLGVSMVDIATGKPKDAVTLMDEMRAKLLEIPAGAERAQAAQDAFGGRLKELIPLVTNTSGSLRELMDEQIAAGTVYDEQTKGSLKRFDEAMDKLGRTWDAVMTKIKGWVGTAIVSVYDWISKAAGAVANFGGKIYDLGVKMGLVTPKVEAQKQETKQLETAMKEATNATNAHFVSQAELRKRAEEAAKAQEANAAATKKLKEETENAMRPMDDLSEKIDKQMKLGWSRSDLIKLHSDEILKAAAAQARLGQPLTENQQILHAEAIEFDILSKRATDATFRLDETTNAVIELGKKVDEKPLDPEKFGIKSTLELLPEIPIHLGNTRTAISEAEKAGQEFGKEVSTIFTNMAQILSKNIVEWKGWAETGLSTVKTFAETALSYLFKGLFKPLNELMEKFGENLSDWISDAMGGFGKGGKAGTGLLGSLQGVFAGVNGLIGGGIAAGGMLGLQSNNVWAKAGGAAGMGILGAGTVAAMLGKTTLLKGLAAVGPWGALAAGGLFAGLGLAKLAKGPNSYQAGAKEAMRDYGVSVRDKEMKALYDMVGISESNAWGYRKNLSMSPVILQQLGIKAKMDGTYDTFLEKLESQMGHNWRDAFELGDTTGKWEALNQVFEKVFGNCGDFFAKLPGGKESLMAYTEAVDEAAIRAGALDQNLVTLKEAFEGLKPTTEDIYEQFLENGTITEEFRQKIEDLGGDMAAFESYSKIKQLSSTFAAARAEWEQDQTVMEGLRDVFAEAGINLQILDNAALLPNLKEGLGELQSLKSAIEDAFEDIIPKQLSPIQQFLQQGIVTPELEAQLAAIVPDFYAPGGLAEQLNALGGLITEKIALEKDSSEAGKQALDDINAKLKDLVPGVIQAITDAESNVKAKIEQYTSEMETAMNTAQAYITSTMETARQAVVGSLESILTKMGDVAVAAATMASEIANAVAASNSAYQAGQNTVNDIQNTIDNSTADDGYIDLGRWGKIPGYDRGTPYVPYDQVALLHKGEAVLTKEENANHGRVVEFHEGDLTINVQGDASESTIDKIIAAIELNREGSRVRLRKALA